MNLVFVYIYDLSKGLANQLSLTLLGKHVSGIWHTGIVVYDKEIYFGSNGIESCPPNGTVLGEPTDKVELGYTNISYDDLHRHLTKLSNDIFHRSKYDLMHHNCNTFSNELGVFLTGKGIPEHITNLPRDILETPFGQMIKPFLDNLSPVVSAAYNSVATHYSQIQNKSSKMTLFYYEEQLIPIVDSFLREEIHPSEANLRSILKNIVSSLKDSTLSYIPDELIDYLAKEPHIVTVTESVITDVLRLFVLKSIECVVALFVDPIVWLRTYDQQAHNDDLNNLKCKFLCNLIGKHFEVISSNEVCLQIIIKFALKCLRSPTTMQTASSLIRNIVVSLPLGEGDAAVSDETVLDIGSCLVHLVAAEEMVPDETTRENIIGSTLQLVRRSALVRDIARAQDVQRRVRRETPFCLDLYRELQ